MYVCMYVCMYIFIGDEPLDLWNIFCAHKSLPTHSPCIALGEITFLLNVHTTYMH